MLGGYIDNEQHFLTRCNSFTLKRNCFFSKMSTIVRDFSNLSPEHQTATLLCPNSVVTAKLVNKYIQIMFRTRKLLDGGVPAFNLGYERGAMVQNEFFEDSDTDEENGEPDNMNGGEV